MLWCCHIRESKDRAAVLRFEEDVINYLSGQEDALYFPLSLSGYQVSLRPTAQKILLVLPSADRKSFSVPLQRLLAHRVAQYHGLQTVTVDDGGDHHGKIKATKPQPSLEMKQVSSETT